MIEQKYKDIVTEELIKNTLDNDVHVGFFADYRVLSCLLKIYQPQTIFEIGTSIGGGVNVMATALPSANIYSLDLPLKDRIGSAAVFPYTQLRGDSMTFDFSQYPCEAYFIDGEHDYLHPFNESMKILGNAPKIIIYHDADIPEVWRAITEVFNVFSNYTLYRVIDTRIAYAVRNSDSNV